MTSAVEPARATSARDGWGREDDPQIAVERLLDAAGVVFASKGISATRMRDVAAAAGCSRGTLYRYFPDRDQLGRAYVDREAARVGQIVLERIGGITNPPDLLVEAIVIAVDEVRHDPFLAAWFDPASAATAGHFALRGEVIAELIGSFLDTLFAGERTAQQLRPGVDRDLAIEWVARVVLSLLTEPASHSMGPAAVEAPARLLDRSDPTARERALLHQLLVPALFAPR
jgi:AcrR family transcriptional regulator